MLLSGFYLRNANGFIIKGLWDVRDHQKLLLLQSSVVILTVEVE